MSAPIRASSKFIWDDRNAECRERKFALWRGTGAAWCQLQVEKSKITCVLGRNGVGKTSLMRAIVGHQPLSSGKITFEGTAFGRSAAYERSRAGVAYVPQGREIFPLLTVRENLETGFAPIKRKDRYIPDHVYDLFPVLKDMLHRRGGDLSGGQQQQLAIGRALVTRPKLLVLDEPTEGIQPSIIKDIGRAIRSSATAPGSPSCWWSSISISAGSSPTGFSSWTAAKSSIRAKPPTLTGPMCAST